MREGLIGLRHLMGFISFANGCALAGRGVHELRRQLLGHGAARAAARRGDQPAHRQRELALAADLDRHLIGRAADAPWLHLEHRRRGTQRLLEDLDRAALGTLLHELERVVDNALGDTALAVPHEAAHQTGDVPIVVLWVRQHDAMRDRSSSRHKLDYSSGARQREGYRGLRPGTPPSNVYPLAAEPLAPARPGANCAQPPAWRTFADAGVIPCITTSPRFAPTWLFVENSWLRPYS